MSLANGRPFLALPGPSVIPDRVLQAMHQPAPDIYGDALAERTIQIKKDLQTVARTDGDALIYIGNGHAGWEAALNNIVNPGDRLLALETGRFTRGWIDVAERLGARIDTMDFGTANPLDPDRVDNFLRADTNHTIKAVLVVQVDTASSVRNDIKNLRRALDASNHPALLMVDCIASFGCERFDMDDWGVDVTVSACQKGLMTPPGLAFNHINDKAWAVRQHATQVTGYWDWAPRRDPEAFFMNFYGTAPTHHLFGLAEALTMILREEGLETVFKRHAVLAKAVSAAVDGWATNGPLHCNIADPSHRSHAVTTIQTGNCDADALRHWCETQAGLTLGVGLSLEGPSNPPKSNLFRIGHMGHVNPPMILGTLATIDAGLKALGIAHGQDALARASRVVADGP